jgi:hypothetical protein
VETWLSADLVGLMVQIDAAWTAEFARRRPPDIHVFDFALGS